MKITYLYNVRFPSERAHAAQIAHMCQAFAELGNEVALYTNKRGVGTLAAVEIEFGFQPKFSLRTLSPQYLYGTGKLAFVWRELLFVSSFWWQYKKEDADIIYSRSEWILYLLSFVISSKQFVFESHEAKYSRAVRRLVRLGVPIVVISEGIRDYYLEQGVPRAQLLVAHDAIDDSFLEKSTSKSEARERLGLPQDKFIAMYIGGFDKWKGVQTFFEAASLASEIMFVAIGGKEEELPVLQKQYPQVHFLGPRPYRDLPHNQRAADVLVIPNTAENDLSAKYTSPLKLFAHMTSGVPIVVSDVPSLLSVVSDSEVTFYEPDNPAQLAHAMIGVKNNFESKHSAAARLQTKSSQYSWRNRANSIFDVLSRVVLSQH